MVSSNSQFINEQKKSLMNGFLNINNLANHEIDFSLNSYTLYEL